MEKIVGKNLLGRLGVFFVCIFFASFSSALHAQVTLKAFDMEGHELRQAGAGQPFTLEVDVQGLGNVMQKPTIDAPDSITMRSVGYHMASVNSDVTIKHKYRVVAQTPGAYWVGPAKIEKDGREYVSNKIKIEVGQQAVAATPVNEAKNAPVALLELTVDKDRVVVGEPIQCVLRFYYTDQVLQMAPINKPDLKGFANDVQQGPFKGTKDIKNKKYAYLEWRWSTRAERPGTQTIGSHSADFTVQSGDDLMKRFGFFVNNVGEQKRVYSNAVKIVVEPLPEYDGPIHAIGSFSNMSARLHPAVAKVGEGMVLTISIDGDGSFDSKNCAQLLQGLPDEFKHYDSKQYVAEKKHADSKPQHCFEFIVQGIKAGTYQIQALKFTFFDVTTRRYKTLESMPIDVVISPTGARNAPVSQSLDQFDQQHEITDDIRSVRAYVPAFSIFSYAIPWWLFFVLVFVPLVIFYVLVGRAMVVWLIQRVLPYRRKRKIFAHVRALLVQAEKTQKMAIAYNAFKDFFAEQIGCEPLQLTHDMIEQELKNNGFSQAELFEWNDFYNVLAEQVFFGKQKTIRVDLIARSRAWVAKFELCDGFKDAKKKEKHD